jgi:purine nucleosidase
VTAVAGNVNAEQATRNVQAIIEQLDPPRWPRIGAAVEPDRSPAIDSRHLYGPDGLGGSDFRVAELHHQHPSEKVITDEIRAAPGRVTIIALGPLTNIAQVLRRDPSLAMQIGQLVIMGGAIRAPGNATPAAEFNMYFDPLAAREVLRSRVTKTLVPLDATNQVVMTYGHLEQLPSEQTKTGAFLRKILPYTFRAHRQLMGLEGIHLHDSVALLAATDPELFITQQMAGDVETAGELTTGATIFDRRQVKEWRPNMDVVVDLEAQKVIDTIISRLNSGAPGNAMV